MSVLVSIVYWDGTDDNQEASQVKTNGDCTLIWPIQGDPEKNIIRLESWEYRDILIFSK